MNCIRISHLLSSVLVFVLSSLVTSVSQATTNVALGKTVEVGAVYGGPIYGGDKLVDGIIGEGGQMITTNNPQNNWAKIDLGAEYDISEVILYNRNCCEAGRVRDVVITYLGADNNTVLGSYTYNGNLPKHPTPSRFDLSADNVRFVKIKNGGSYLQLYEAQVMGVPSNNTGGQPVIPSQPGGGPSVGPYGCQPAAVPGIVEAEHFNLGGQGVAYNDSDTSNNGISFGNTFRSQEGVDLVSKGSEGIVVGWTNQGEWLRYDLSIAVAGDYDIVVRAASANSDSRLIVSFDNIDASFPIAMDRTGGTAPEHFRDFTISDVALAAGNEKMRLFVASNGGFDINRVTFTASAGNDGGSQPPLIIGGDPTNSVDPTAINCNTWLAAPNHPLCSPTASKFQEFIGDFNGDGVNEIVRRENNQVWIYTEDGVGVLVQPGNVSAWIISAVGDVDRDGADDIIFHHKTDEHRVFWKVDQSFKLSGSGWFTMPKESISDIRYVMADVDGDGNDDMVSHHKDGTVTVSSNPLNYSQSSNSPRTTLQTWSLLGADTTTSQFAKPFSHGWTLEGAGYLNNDEYEDLIWRDKYGSIFAWYVFDDLQRSPYDRDFTEKQIVVGGPVSVFDWYIIGTSNLRGTGREDIILRNPDVSDTNFLAYEINSSGLLEQSHQTPSINSSTVNIGQIDGGYAYQSSAYDISRFPATNARNGINHGNYNSAPTQAITATKFQSNPWWELNLERDRNINRVNVYHRFDGGFSSRSDGMLVEIFNSDKSVTLYSNTFTVTSNPVPTQIDFPMISGARYIRISLPGNNRLLSLAEVVVFGEVDNVCSNGYVLSDTGTCVLSNATLAHRVGRGLREICNGDIKNCEISQDKEQLMSLGSLEVHPQFDWSSLFTGINIGVNPKCINNSLTNDPNFENGNNLSASMTNCYTNDNNPTSNTLFDSPSIFDLTTLDQTKVKTVVRKKSSPSEYYMRMPVSKDDAYVPIVRLQEQCFSKTGNDQAMRISSYVGSGFTDPACLTEIVPESDLETITMILKPDNINHLGGRAIDHWFLVNHCQKSLDVDDFTSKVTTSGLFEPTEFNNVEIKEICDFPGDAVDLLGRVFTDPAVLRQSMDKAYYENVIMGLMFGGSLRALESAGTITRVGENGLQELTQVAKIANGTRLVVRTIDAAVNLYFLSEGLYHYYRCWNSGLQGHAFYKCQAENVAQIIMAGVPLVLEGYNLRAHFNTPNVEPHISPPPQVSDNHATPEELNGLIEHAAAVGDFDSIQTEVETTIENSPDSDLIPPPKSPEDNFKHAFDHTEHPPAVDLDGSFCAAP